MPPGPTGNAWKPMVSGRACPAAATLMTTPLRKTSSAASSVSWSTSSTILQGQLHRTMSLPISKPFTTPSAPILPSAGVHLQVLRLNLPLPPPDCSTFYLCVFIRLFPLFLCPFLGEWLKRHFHTGHRRRGWAVPYLTLALALFLSLSLSLSLALVDKCPLDMVDICPPRPLARLFAPAKPALPAVSAPPRLRIGR